MIMIMIFARSITKSDFQIFVVLFNYSDSDARLTCKMFINSADEKIFSSNIVLILLLYGRI